VKFSSSSGVRFPNDVDIDDLDNDVKSFVCASTNLDSVYKEIQRTYLDKVRRTYIGLSYGFFRDYPATMLSNNDGTCL
jgi:hypothetical protein